MPFVNNRNESEKPSVARDKIYMEPLIPAMTSDRRLKSKDNNGDGDAKRERESVCVSFRFGRRSVPAAMAHYNERQDATGTGCNELGIRKQFQKRRKPLRHRRTAMT